MIPRTMVGRFQAAADFINGLGVLTLGRAAKPHRMHMFSATKEAGLSKHTYDGDTHDV